MLKTSKVLFFLFFSSLSPVLLAQSAKSNNLSFFNYSYPEAYIPQPYDSYEVDVNLSNKPKSIIVDGLQVRTIEALSFNTFFKKSQLLFSVRNLALKDYTINIVQKKNASNFIVDVLVDNVAFVGKINKSDLRENPYAYNVSYRYDLIYTLKNSLTGEIFLSKQKTIENNFNSFDVGDNTIASFKTETEAKDYLSKYLDKSLMGNDLIHSIEQNVSAELTQWLDVKFYNRNSSFTFYKISKETKHPTFVKINTEIDLLKEKSKIEEKIQEDFSNKKNNINYIDKYKTLTGSTTDMVKNENETQGFQYTTKVTVIMKDFVSKMKEYAAEFDINDDKQIVGTWACYINIASSYQVLNNYKGSLEYIQKAKDLKIEERIVRQLENGVLDSSKNHDNFFDKFGVLKSDVNERYGKYLKY